MFLTPITLNYSGRRRIRLSQNGEPTGGSVSCQWHIDNPPVESNNAYTDEDNEVPTLGSIIWAYPYPDQFNSTFGGGGNWHKVIGTDYIIRINGSSNGDGQAGEVLGVYNCNQ